MNNKLLFLLNPSIISDLSKTYLWAVTSQQDFDNLSDREKRDVVDYRINWDYKKVAVEIINTRYKDQLELLGISGLSWNDLERSHCILQVNVPKDRLGIIYLWIFSYLPLLNDEKNPKLTLNAVGASNLKEFLYRKFMLTLENNPISMSEGKSITTLKRSKDGAVDPRSLEGMFMEVLEIAIHYNITLREYYTNIENKLRDPNA